MEGIEKIDLKDIKIADQLNLRIKLLGFSEMINGKLFEIIRTIYRDDLASIKIGDKYSEPFQTNKGEATQLSVFYLSQQSTLQFWLIKLKCVTFKLMCN